MARAKLSACVRYTPFTIILTGEWHVQFTVLHESLLHPLKLECGKSECYRDANSP